jgi:hypothetical protein
MASLDEYEHEKKTLSSLGFKFRTVQPVASRYTECRISAPFKQDKLGNTVGYARTNVIRSRTWFVLAYIEIYEFRGNPFQAHSLEQSYHPTQPFKQEKYHALGKSLCT